MTTSFVIKGGTLANGSLSDIAISDGVITQLGSDIVVAGATIISARR